jgi:hypothetical protein
MSLMEKMMKKYEIKMKTDEESGREEGVQKEMQQKQIQNTKMDGREK